MRCSEVIEKLEQLSPRFFAESWDNVGLLAGRRDKDVRRIYVAVDASDKVMNEVLLSDADMLITHHPLLFSPVKSITTDDFIGKRLVYLLQNDISYYAMHTNFDVTHMAEIACDYLNLEARSVLDVTYECETGKYGIGKNGIFRSPMSLRDCAELVKTRFHGPYVRVYGDLNSNIQTVAITPGSGKSTIKAALKTGVDVLITGDIDHHEGIDANAQGLAVIDAGHYGIEHIFVPYMEVYLRETCGGVDIITEKFRNPFVTL